MPTQRGPIVVCGVSGCGKSTVGAALAAHLGVPFVDADDLHPAANIAKMAAGQPLTDSDRLPWLDAVGRWLADHADGVCACSALRHGYRDQLCRRAPGVRFVMLAVDPGVVKARVRARHGHFMPATLVDSQFAALEPHGPDEPGITVDATLPLDGVVDEIVDRVLR
ncbi:gluconokinase [Gordonia aichiensis]|uniref:Gluconokinase n=1 Tax=Gordonia aichiensis NBRC 108223 TaxID=1220583 RepID=L7KN56_9ACTN|nr:gluconokinase [Gordonia aichiensis]GAC50305.1 gluconokinase [Gordonia aichiensis NBRC 108223]